MIVLRSVVFLIVGCTICWRSAVATEPGLPTTTYDEDQLFEPLGIIDREVGARSGHSLVAMHLGHLVVVESRDGGKGDGSFSFYDIGDPAAPRLVAKHHDERTKNLREAHTYAFATIGDRRVVTLLARDGLQFWDWSDLEKPQRLAALRLSKMGGGDYGNTPWWFAQQGRLVFVGGTDTGLHVVDASDPTEPRALRRIPTLQTGGFRIGPVFAVGNLLVLTSMDKNGIATMDIGDPLHPVLLDHNDGNVGYSAMFNGERLYGIHTRLHVWDLREPTRIDLLGKSDGKTGGKGGYGLFQDGFVHMGASSNYAKVDVRDPSAPAIVAKMGKHAGKSDIDGGNVVGHLAIASCDHGTGSVIAPHATAPDTAGPRVTMVNPPDGASGQPLTTRVGLTLSDRIDAGSVNAGTFRVSDRRGRTVPGSYSVQTGVVNFCPDAALHPNETYRVEVVADGLRDYAGNPVEEAVATSFRTGGGGEQDAPERRQLRTALRLLKAGRKDSAETILKRLVDADPDGREGRAAKSLLERHF